MKNTTMKVLGPNATIEDVTQAAISVYDALVADTIHFGRAKEMTNALGKTINSVKIRLEYAALRKEKPDIAFMECQKATK